MDPEQQQQPGRIFGMPWWVIIGIAGVAAYFLFFRNSSSSGSGTGASSSAGSGTVTSSGSTTLDSGAVSVTVTQNGNGGQPTPPTTTSTGTSSQVAVPDVVGQRGAAAKTTLEKAGFKVSQSPKTTPKGKSTTVTSQSPKAGTKAAKGSTVKDTVKVNK
jgi:PASTA domain